MAEFAAGLNIQFESPVALRGRWSEHLIRPLKESKPNLQRETHGSFNAAVTAGLSTNRSRMAINP
jgi:hypothetical protein